MSFKELESRIIAIRARAKSVGAQYGRDRKEIEQNTNLSDEGKRSELAQLRTEARASMSSLLGEEKAAVAAERAKVEREFFGTAGTDPMSVLNYRDAAERADKLESAADATALMTRALASGDKTLALAVAQVAVAKHYTAASRMFAAANPAIAAAADELDELTNLAENGMLERSVAYMVY